MTTAHICYTCHAVRNCKECCARCKSPCNAKHFCAIKDNHMTETEGWEWYFSVMSVFDKEYITPFIPDNIIEKVRKLTAKPVQLKLDLRI